MKIFPYPRSTTSLKKFSFESYENPYFFLEGDFSDFFSKFSNSSTLEFSSFRKIYDDLLTSLGVFCKFESLESFGTNFKLAAVTRPFYYDWFQSLR